jgi:hypothetical protein
VSPKTHSATIPERQNSPGDKTRRRGDGNLGRLAIAQASDKELPSAREARLSASVRRTSRRILRHHSDFVIPPLSPFAPWWFVLPHEKPRPTRSVPHPLGPR